MNLNREHKHEILIRALDNKFKVSYETLQIQVSNAVRDAYLATFADAVRIAEQLPPLWRHTAESTEVYFTVEPEAPGDKPQRIHFNNYRTQIMEPGPRTRQFKHPNQRFVLDTRRIKIASVLTWTQYSSQVEFDIPLNSLYGAMLQGLNKGQMALNKEIGAFQDNIERVFYSCRTFKQLEEKVPELAALLPENYLEPKGKAVLAPETIRKVREALQ